MSKTTMQSSKRKFRHGLGDIVSPACGCNAEIEDTEHFLLSCKFLFHSNI